MTEETREPTLFEQAGFTRLIVLAAVKNRISPKNALAKLVKLGGTANMSVSHPDISLLRPDLASMIFSALDTLKRMDPDQLLAEAVTFAEAIDKEEIFGSKYDLQELRRVTSAESEKTMRRIADLERQLNEKKQEVVALLADGKSANRPKEIYDGIARMFDRLISIVRCSSELGIAQFTNGSINGLIGCHFISTCLYRKQNTPEGRLNISANTMMGRFQLNGNLDVCEIHIEIKNIASNRIGAEVAHKIAESFSNERYPLTPVQERKLHEEIKDELEHRILSRRQKELLEREVAARLRFYRSLNWVEYGRPIGFLNQDIADQIIKGRSDIYTIQSLTEIMNVELDGGESWGRPILCASPLGVLDGVRQYRLKVFPGVAKGPFTIRNA